MIQRELRILQASLIFFTRIPLCPMDSFSAGAFQKASRYFPVVGWIVGITGAFAYMGAVLLFPRALAVLISMTATILLTGALHEDGFADFCDGMGAGWTREQILSIMKDSYIGVYGTLALILSLGAKLLCLLALPGNLLPFALVCGHSLSRSSAISMMYTHDYAGKEDRSSKSRSVAERMSIQTLIFTTLTGILPFALFSTAISSWPVFWIGLSVVIGVRLGLGWYLFHKLHGYTGDCLGAVQQISELTFYLALVVLTSGP
ncbi:adenosylcobinamide-GDP ribazoletransferase [candidate division KSB3 bacterium]|uniref:Adenosylcobinamide-GDP ribazoletransferase n=1 Tax=candidate division KSB3 bacterium TaxID=2044937 RepID=A0A2G6EAI9_9BACT|nr:MAG: adenosylcobinamide-GDP ribazoletransferase [candidate division KSB3 bacterium]PIE30852.1 MAG: adenosylcobinamide-GDP ribazoletransferase [candidate division KSB3 bacterium]